MIKREMLMMLHHDALEVPAPNQQLGGASGKKAAERGIVGEAAHRAYLDRHPYREYEKEDLEKAK